MYDAVKTEEEVLRFWEENKIFDKRVAKNKGNKKFKFYDGPITANNPMGVHHAWGRTSKDMYQRFYGLRGYDQRYQNGFDCQGLHVEVEVEKTLALNSKKDIEKLGVDKFSNACRNRVMEQSKGQMRNSIRLGQWMDWDHNYYTNSDNNILHIWHFLKKCHENKWIYKGHKVMTWCHRCGTSLSQHELYDSYREMTHKAVYVEFPLVGKDASLLVWTTTPWTLPANVSVAVNPEFTYAKAKGSEGTYYVVKSVAEKLGLKILEEIKGKDMIGWKYKGPFDELPAQKGVEHKVIPWKDVGEEEGTGLVHNAPGCGEEDFELSKQFKLAVIAPLDESGYFIDGFGLFTGKHVDEVSHTVVKMLKDEKNILFKAEDYLHNYPICWRCKTPVVFRAVDEWFISCNEIRPKMLAANKKVKWYPEFMQDRMADWLNNMGDWCISRKRYYGLPLPFWLCDCGELTVISSLAELRKLAVKPELVDKLPELHKPWMDEIDIKCPKCKKQVQRVKDIGDCWLDAGIVPFSTLNYLTDRKYWEQWFPADLICEMREQIRLWFYSMMFMGITLEGKCAYNAVETHEKVYDEKGKPMHKSSGNAIWFDDAIGKMGADVMRWMYMTSNPADNMKFGFTIGKEINQKLSFLLNMGNYFEQLAANTKYSDKVKKLELEDRWLLSRLNTVKKTVTEEVENMHPHKATAALENFFIEDLSRGYLQFVRDRISSTDEDERKTVMHVFYTTLKETLQLLSPFVPFISESVYQKNLKKLAKAESVHLLDWPSVDEKQIDSKLESQMEAARQAIQSVAFVRETMKRSAKWPLAKIVIVTKEKSVKESIDTLKDLIMQQSNVKAVLVSDKEPKGNFEPAEQHDFKVLVDKTITDELNAEGFAREVMRLVQSLRKQANLKKEDQIDLHVEINQNLKAFEKQIKDKVGAKTIAIESKPTAKKYQHKLEKEIEGKKVVVSFDKV